MTFKFNVLNHSLSPASDFSAYSGNENYYECEFDFLSSDWQGLSKFAVFTHNDTSFSLPLEDNKCLIPSEVLKSGGTVYMGVFGTNSDEENYTRLSTGLVCLNVGNGAYCTASAPEAPTPDIWEQYYAEITKVGGYADRADAAAASAQESAQSAYSDKEAAAQALSDLLKMLGTDIATLVDGKIPVSQIPSIATTEIYTASSQAEMEALPAQDGDICIRTDENKSYIYSGGWIYLVAPTDYSAISGYADVAGTAENANMINNHRLVEMSDSDFETAVKDPDTYYLVY